MMQMPPERERLIQIFHPYALERLANAQSQGTRFVYYTSADAAISILKNKEVWMRKSSCMNNFFVRQRSRDGDSRLNRRRRLDSGSHVG